MVGWLLVFFYNFKWNQGNYKQMKVTAWFCRKNEVFLQYLKKMSKMADMVFKFPEKFWKCFWTPVLPSVSFICLSVHPLVQYFSQEFVITFCWCFARWYIIGISTNWQSSFFRKIHFYQIWAKRAQNGPKKVFWIFRKILWLLFPENNLKWRLILLMIFHHQSHIWQNSALEIWAKMLPTYQIKGFFKMEYLKKETHIQNNRFAYLWNISRKTLVMKLLLLPKKITQNFLQVDSITLGAQSQAWPKSPK